MTGSAVPRDKKTLQGERLSKKADSNAILFFFVNSFIKKYIRITDKTPNMALGARTAKIVFPNNFKDPAITYGRARGRKLP